MRGRHLIKFWSKTQSIVALSSAEAELHGSIKATAESLGIVSLFRDVGRLLFAGVFTDASATLSMIKRRGLGKTRHVDTNYLWIQDVHDRREVSFDKVKGEENPSDLLTKHLTWDLMTKHVQAMGLQ